MLYMKGIGIKLFDWKCQVCLEIYHLDDFHFYLTKSTLTEIPEIRGTINGNINVTAEIEDNLLKRIGTELKR